MMVSIDADIGQGLQNLELVRTLKRHAEPVEKAYRWMIRLGIHLHPQETVGTIAFSCKGRHRISHLTWSEIISVHQAYERLHEVEVHLKAREIKKPFVERLDVHEPE